MQGGEDMEGLSLTELHCLKPRLRQAGDGCNKFLRRDILQYITGSTVVKGIQNIVVIVKCCKHNDPDAGA